MNDPSVFPAVDAASLPETLLRLPVHSPADASGAGPIIPDAALQQLGERLEPVISALIARKTRQRRYTP